MYHPVLAVFLDCAINTGIITKAIIIELNRRWNILKQWKFSIQYQHGFRPLGHCTWSRTPERLLYFDPESISQYVSRQKKIIDNTVAHLKNGGYYFYITCSVYQNENEDMVNYIRQKFSLSLRKMEYLRGAGIHADTLFVACFNKII